MILKRINNTIKQFRKNYYNQVVRGLSKYVKPITDVGGTIGEGIYATKAFLPYNLQPTAELISKGLLGAQRAVEVGVNVAKAKDYATAIENSKRIIPAIKAGQDVYGTVRQNYLINQARNRYNPRDDVLTMPARGSRAYAFMESLGTNDGMSNRAD